MVVSIAAVGAVLIGLVTLLIVVLPSHVVTQGAGIAPRLTSAERLAAENDVRSVLLQALGGLLALSGVAVGAAATLRQVRVNREGHTIELFTKAIEQLSSDRLSVRHGGIYALEQLAHLAPHYRGHIHALLTAFVREHAPWPPVRPDADLDAERQRYHGGLSDDVGAAMGALSGGAMIEKGNWSELEKVDLRGAELSNLNLRRTCFIGSNLEGADLSRANLEEATLSHAILRNADLSGANLAGATLDGTDLTGVTSDNKTRWPSGFQPARSDT